MKGILQTACWCLRGKLSFAGLYPLEQLGRVLSSCSHAVPCSAKTPNCSRPRARRRVLATCSPASAQIPSSGDALSQAEVQRPDFRGLPPAACTTRWVCLAEALLSGSRPALPCTCHTLRPSASPPRLSLQPHPSRVPQGTEAPHPHSPRGRQSSQVGRPHADVSREYSGHTDRLSWHRLSW